MFPSLPLSLQLTRSHSRSQLHLLKSAVENAQTPSDYATQLKLILIWKRDASGHWRRHPPPKMGTPGKIFGKNSKHTHKNFLYDPFTGRRVQRPFGWRCERELPEPTANGGRGTDNPKEGLGLMLLLSVSNLILFYIVFVCVVVVAINFSSFFQQQMQLFSSCGASLCHDVTRRLVCLWRLC